MSPRRYNALTGHPRPRGDRQHVTDPDLAGVGKELLPAARAFQEAVGQTSVGQEIGQWLADVVRYRRASHQARLLMRAAEKIRASGLPASAVEDRLLRAVLEEGAFEDDERMQERWARLLASAATGVTVPPAFPEILRQLEPIEARLLDELVRVRRPLLHGQLTYIGHLSGVDGLEWRHLDNLERLQVANWQWHGPVNVPLPDDPAECGLDVEIYETQLGRALVDACAEPANDR
jgi:hypothetical protein